MKLENQLCTFEQAKRLRELGIVQESLFYQYRGLFTNVIVEADFFKKYTSKIARYSAFTVAELIQMLPTTIWDKDFQEKMFINISREFRQDDCGNYTISYNRGQRQEIRGAEVLSHCLAAMLIYLLENNKVTAEQCNQALQAA